MTVSDNKQKSLILDGILEWLDFIIGSVFAVVLVFTFLIRVLSVNGNSMNSTLYNNDIVLSTYLWCEPQNNDIVVVNSDYLNEQIVKRVIATQGQTVVIDYENNLVSVDGKVLSEHDYLKEKIMYDNKEKFNQEFFDSTEKKYIYTVPENCIFVMGDNRNHSTDSRTFGFVSNEDIIGKVFFRASSPYGSVGFI